MMNGFTSTQGAVQQRPFIVGLTGGIASGKSTVSRYLAETYAVPIVDTDVIARNLVNAGSSTLNEIVEHFGESIIDSHGQLKRRELRNRISENTEDRLWLNALMHPKIYDEAIIQVKQYSTSYPPYLVIVIPLLNTDSPYLKLLNEIWLVDCDEERQKQHLINRDQMNANTAQQLINAQPSRKERLMLATHIIDNNGSIDQLIKQTKELHSRFI